MAAGALTWIGTHQPHFVSGRVDFGKASGELFSLGYGGMLVRSSFGLSKGTELHVRFVVLGYGGCFEAEGRVVGTDLDVLAIMFLTRSPELLDLLQSMNAVAGVPDYDFSEFVASVLELELNQMIHCVDREIEEIGKVRFENSARRIRRQIYESELNRLRFFLRTGRIQKQTTQPERECYKQLSTRLVAKGVVCQAFLELREPSVYPYAIQRRPPSNRRAFNRRKAFGAIYTGPERRSGAERRSVSNRRASQI